MRIKKGKKFVGWIVKEALLELKTKGNSFWTPKRFLSIWDKRIDDSEVMVEVKIIK
jgi:hypothetical protein